MGTASGLAPRPSRVEPDLAALAATEGPGGVSWFEHARRRYLSPLAGDTVQVLWDGAFNLVEGERVRSYSGRGWWDASVVRKDAGGRFLVHYLRWSAAVWDEWVPPARIRWPPADTHVAMRWQRGSWADRRLRRQERQAEGGVAVGELAAAAGRPEDQAARSRTTHSAAVLASSGGQLGRARSVSMPLSFATADGPLSRTSREVAAAEAAERRDACVAEAHRRWPWLARAGVLDPMRGPTAADADSLAQLCADGEARRDCEGLPDLRPGDVVELRCVSSLGRSPWLETVVDAVVPMEWSRRALTPDVEAAVIEQLELWLEAHDAEATRRRELGEDAADRPASPFAATPSPLAALAPQPVAVSGRGRPTGHGHALDASDRGSVNAPPSAVHRRAVVPAMGAVSFVGHARQPSLNGAGARAAASAAVSRISGTSIPRTEREALPFGTVAFRVGIAVMDDDNRLVARHRLRLLRRGPAPDDAGATAGGRPGRRMLGCAASPGAAASRPRPAPQEPASQSCAVM